MLPATRWAAIVVLAASTGGGCQRSGPAPPKTYPVTGQVIVKGGQPLTGGVVEFRPAAEPSLTTLGDIGPDGTFSLRTLFNGQSLPGAVEGTYQVTVSPVQDKEHHGAPAIQLAQPCTVEAKENRFVFEVDLP